MELMSVYDPMLPRRSIQNSLGDPRHGSQERTYTVVVNGDDGDRRAALLPCQAFVCSEQQGETIGVSAFQQLPVFKGMPFVMAGSLDWNVLKCILRG